MINRIFNIRGKNIIYKLENFSDLSEQKAIDISLGCAFNMSQFILRNLKSADANTARIMRKIYGENADAQRLSDLFKEIVGRIEKKFFARREKVFIGEGGEEKPEVFSGADCGLQKIIIYDAFFKRMPGDESGLNDRASVLIHEMAHLNGLEGDEELGSINSAESLRNFALLACGLADEEKLFAKIEESAQGKLQGEDGELPYRPDQPRAPKGQPNGGQWIPENYSGGGEIKTANKNSPSRIHAKNSEDEETKDYDDLVYRENKYEGEARKRNIDDPEFAGKIKAIAAEVEDELAKIKELFKGLSSAESKNMIQDNRELQKNTTLLSQENKKDEKGANSSEDPQSDSPAPDKNSSNSLNIPDDKYDEVKNKIKDSNTKDPVAFVGEIDENRNSLYNFKSEAECQTTEIKVADKDESSTNAGEWHAEDILVGNLPPNSEESFIQHMEYEYRDKEGNAHHEEADFLLKGKTNDDGMALIPRVGIHYQKDFGEYGEDGKEYKDVKIKMEVSHIKDGVPKNVKVDKNSKFQYNTPNELKEYAKRHAINNGGGEIEKGSNVGRRGTILTRNYRLPEKNSRR